MTTEKGGREGERERERIRHKTDTLFIIALHTTNNHKTLPFNVLQGRSFVH